MFAVTLDGASGFQEIMIHLAYPSLEDIEREGKVVTGNHRMIDEGAQRSLLRWRDAEGRHSLRYEVDPGNWTGG